MANPGERFVAVVEETGFEELTKEDLDLLNRSFSHGGPGSGRYPAGSSGNEASPSNDTYGEVVKAMEQSRLKAPTKKQIAEKMRGKPQTNDHFSRPEAMARITEVEASRQDSKIEIGTLFDEDGIIIFEKEGTAGSVPMTASEHEKVALLSKNTRAAFSHNHPPHENGSGTVQLPPSENDYLFARSKGLAEMRTTCKDGTTYIIRPFEGKELPRISKNQFAGVEFQVVRAMRTEGTYKAGNIRALDKKGNPTNKFYLVPEAVTSLNERMWQRSAEIYGFEFKKVT